MEKRLGKITSAKFGIVDDYPFLIGLLLQFKMESSSVGDGGKHTINIHNVRPEDTLDIFKYIHKLLKEAKVSCVEDLKGVPVEITLYEGQIFHDFRILTEVI
jgi:hypothetical protein